MIFNFQFQHGEKFYAEVMKNERRSNVTEH